MGGCVAAPQGKEQQRAQARLQDKNKKLALEILDLKRRLEQQQAALDVATSTRTLCSKCKGVIESNTEVAQDGQAAAQAASRRNSMQDGEQEEGEQEDDDDDDEQQQQQEVDADPGSPKSPKDKGLTRANSNQFTAELDKFMASPDKLETLAVDNKETEKKKKKKKKKGKAGGPSVEPQPPSPPSPPCHADSPLNSDSHVAVPWAPTGASIQDKEQWAPIPGEVPCSAAYHSGLMMSHNLSQ